MEIGLQLLPVILSLVLLGAHFLRAGSPIMVAVIVLLMGMLPVRRWWAARTIQVALLLGAAEWVRTLSRLAGAARLRGWYHDGPTRVPGSGRSTG